MLSRRQVILGGAAFLSGCGGIHAVDSADTPAARRRRRQITETVVYARRAELERHHAGPALRAWASNARLTLARSTTKAETDLTLSYGRIAERMVQRLYGPPPRGRRVRFTSPRWEVFGSDAIFEATVEISDPGAQRWIRERYELWLSDIGWVITSCRRWPLRSLVAGRKVRFSPGYWGALDDAAEAATPQSVARARALQSAWRLSEALQTAAAATKSHPQSADAWTIFGQLSAEQGYSVVALSAFERALKLNPKQNVGHLKAAVEAKRRLSSPTTP